MADFDQVERDTALAHLEQLKHLPPKAVKPNPRLKDDSYFNTLVQWTRDNIGTIKAAVGQGVWSKGNKTPNWQRVFLTFMESSATYLRDDAALAESAALYKKATEGKAVDEDMKTRALEMYLDSYAKIRELAAMWGLRFVMIADLWNDPNEPYISPYCGAFYAKATLPTPFIGIAFKGTDAWALWQDDIDWNYQPLQAPAGQLLQSNVSTGVYHSLFDQFNVGGNGQSPYNLIQAWVLKITAAFKPINALPCATHVTGHSLGASYSCLCYMQLLIDLYARPNAPNLQIGDLYNFGCPRVGLQDWANNFWDQINTNKGATFRVVNSASDWGDDPFTTVPPLPVVLYYDGPWFNHVDVGYRISATAPPSQIPTERNTEPAPPSSLTAENAWIHETKYYYQSLQYALKNASEDAKAEE